MAKAVVLLIIIGLILPLSKVQGASIQISVSEYKVETSFRLSLIQNLTSFPKEFIQFTGNQGEEPLIAISNSLRRLSEGASAANLKLTVSSAETRLNVTGMFDVIGVQKRRGSVAEIDLKWRAFKVDRDLKGTSIYYNLVGLRYLRPALERLANLNATRFGVTFFVNGTSASKQTALNHGGNATMMNLISLGKALDKWDREYQVASHTTVWRYKPPSPLSLSVRVSSINGTYFSSAFMDIDVEIISAGLPRTSANTLEIDVGAGWFESLILLSVVAIIATSIIVSRAYGRERMKHLAAK